jgi:glycosyltransferase involved in cell wall biosynthesis
VQDTIAIVIVVLHPSDELYGADRVLLSVVDTMRRGHTVEVWLPTDVEYPAHSLSRLLGEKGVMVDFKPLPVLRRAYANPRDLLAVGRRGSHFASALAQARPEAVYVNTSALAPAVPIAAALGITTTLHVHETWGPFERRALTRLCTPADTLVTVGAATRAALPEVLRRRAVIRRHSVQAPPEDRATSRALRALAGDAPVILYAGRWTPGKGITELVKALSGTQAHLFVLGGPPPSGRTVDVRAAIAAAEVGDQVHLIGEVDDVWPYIYASDAVAVPSIHPESYPTIALEAIAAKRPVLASRIGGLPEIVTPGRGWLLTPGDIRVWAEHLKAVAPMSDLQQ